LAEESRQQDSTAPREWRAMGVPYRTTSRSMLGCGFHRYESGGRSPSD